MTEAKPNPPGGFVVIAYGYWGYGSTLAEAKANFRRYGGRLSAGYEVFAFDDRTVFVGVDNFGSVHYLGDTPENKPTRTITKPRKVSARV